MPARVKTYAELSGFHTNVCIPTIRVKTMSIEDLVLWKDERLTIREIVNLTGMNEGTLRSRYRAAGLDYHRHDYTTVSQWDLAPLKQPFDINGQYVIGFLAADGYIEAHERTIALWIKEDDEEILHRILRTFGREDYVIRRRINSNGCSQIGLYIGSKALVAFLKEQYGFQRQKSRTLPFPTWLPNPLAFLRGYFDGDGYMGVNCTFTIGSRVFAEGFLTWVRNTYGYEPNVQRCGKNKDIYNIVFRKKHRDFLIDLFSYPGLRRKSLAFLRYLPN